MCLKRKQSLVGEFFPFREHGSKECLLSQPFREWEIRENVMQSLLTMERIGILSDSGITSINMFYTLGCAFESNYSNVSHNRSSGHEKKDTRRFPHSPSTIEKPHDISAMLKLLCTKFYKMFRQEEKRTIACLKQKWLELKKALMLNFADKKNKLTTDDCLKRTTFI